MNVAKSSLIAASDLPDFLSLRQEIPREDQSSPEDAYTGDNLYMQECRAIINTLSRCNGNIRLAAQELGIARSALYGKLTRFGIDYAKFRNRYR